MISTKHFSLLGMLLLWSVLMTESTEGGSCSGFFDNTNLETLVSQCDKQCQEKEKKEKGCLSACRGEGRKCIRGCYDLKTFRGQRRCIYRCSLSFNYLSCTRKCVKGSYTNDVGCCMQLCERMSHNASCLSKCITPIHVCLNKCPSSPYTCELKCPQTLTGDSECLDKCASADGKCRNSCEAKFGNLWTACPRRCLKSSVDGGACERECRKFVNP